MLDATFFALLEARIEKALPADFTRAACGILRKLDAAPLDGDLSRPLEAEVQGVLAKLKTVTARYDTGQSQPEGFAGFVLVEFLTMALDVCRLRGPELASRRGDSLFKMVSWARIPGIRQDAAWLAPLTDAFRPPSETIPLPPQSTRTALLTALGRPLGTFYPGAEGREILGLISSLERELTEPRLSPEVTLHLNDWLSRLEKLQMAHYDPLAALSGFLRKTIVLYSAKGESAEENQLVAYAGLEVQLERLRTDRKLLGLIQPLFTAVQAPAQLRKAFKPLRGPLYAAKARLPTSVPTPDPIDPSEEVTVTDGKPR